GGVLGLAEADGAGGGRRGRHRRRGLFGGPADRYRLAFVQEDQITQREREREGGRAMTSVVDNGVNVQALLEAREALAGAPDAAQFTWKASSKWEEGVHSTTTIKNFFGLGGEQTHKS